MQPPFPSLTKEWHNAPYPRIDPTQSALSVKGKTVLITGASRGIGKATALAFASAGASILGLTARTTAALEPVKAEINKKHPETKVHVFAANVLDPAALNKAFETVKAASPNQQGIDILVHNAGYFSTGTLIGDANADADEYWASIETNVRGSYHASRAFLATLRPKQGDHEPQLIALSTAGVAFFPPPPQVSSYFTSMVAKATFFAAFAAENPAVRVLSVHPGAVETEMAAKAKEAGMELPMDDVDLPAWFFVWAVSAEAAWLRNKIVWANWDVDELLAKREEIMADVAYTNLGVKGWPFSA